MGPILEPTPAGSALAAALVVAGAPIFGAGLRALRLRRCFGALAERGLANEPTGLVRVRGRVALESPLVGPLSGKACAGFQLEVRGPRGAAIATVEDLREFRLVSGPASARVRVIEDATWDLAPGETRTLAPGDRVSENLTALLAHSAEATWLRRCGVTLTLVERALLAGQECHVIGSARRARPYEAASEAVLARTGTDDAPVAAARAHAVAAEPELWIEAEGHLEYLRISDQEPDPRRLLPPWWRTLGVALGPMLGLSGLLYLANAADHLRWGDR
jgi:hypothetical protein